MRKKEDSNGDSSGDSDANEPDKREKKEAAKGTEKLEDGVDAAGTTKRQKSSVEPSASQLPSAFLRPGRLAHCLTE